jgi:hypothetical protein
MPGFYNYLEKQGQDLLDKKPEVIIAVPNGSGGLDKHRGGVLKGSNIKKCFESNVFKEKFKRFKTAIIRPANQAERNYFYAMIAFEIKGKPLTTVEERVSAGKPGILMLVYMEGNKLFMIDCILKRE